MSIRRFIVVGVVAAAMWLGFGALRFAIGDALVGAGALVAGDLLNVILPPTFAREQLVPSDQFAAAAPAWTAFAPVVTALFFGALVAGSHALLVPRLSRAAPRWERLLVAWFTVIVAATVATAAVSLLIVAAERPAGAAGLGMALGAAIPQALDGGYFGLVWGWLPALVTTQARTSGRPSLALPASAGTVAVLLLVTAGVLARPALESREAAAEQVRAEQWGDAGPPPPPSEPVETVPPVDGEADRLANDWCTTGQLDYRAGYGTTDTSAPEAETGGDSIAVPEGAAGHRGLPLTVVNVSDAECRLGGYPDVAFGTALGALVEVRVDHGGTMLTDDDGPGEFLLPPGATASAALGWSAMSTAGAEPAAWLHVAASPGLERGMIRVDSDIVSGGSVSVTAWQQN